ncbi:MAG: His Kinase (Phospho-acceptor) protein [Gemmatimonadetes bacterium]|nr:His Kinase (Phospho-acceptor) protein [Gemmatimonadota bacterium]
MIPLLPPGPPDEHVLVVEDDPASARVLRSILEQAGYRVSLAHDGPEALAELDRELPDLLLLDWMLPGISGLEVCHRARQRWNALALPILIVTAKNDPESVYAAFDAGASDHIAKPFRGAEIRARIAAHLRTKALVEERGRMEEHLREREKLSSLGLLASGVAHDLNNPLAVIYGHAQLILRRDPDPAAEDHVRAIMSGVERCRRIVGDLLDFARGRPGTHEPVDVPALVRSTLAMREGDLRDAGIAAVLELPPELPGVTGDAHQLQQVFLNVILNAEQAMRDAGRTLRISASADAAAGADDGGAGWVSVDFFNDGPSIPPEVLPRIFEPFFTTKPKDEGTGLGLAISRRIVREHGGEILAESRQGGTVFRVRLPARVG